MAKRHIRTAEEMRILELIEKMGPAGRVALAQCASLVEARDANLPLTLAHMADFFEVLVGHLRERARDERATEQDLGAILDDIRGAGRLFRRVLDASGIVRVTAGRSP